MCYAIYIIPDLSSCLPQTEIGTNYLNVNKRGCCHEDIEMDYFINCVSRGWLVY